jgi:hypothetical protein
MGDLLGPALLLPEARMIMLLEHLLCVGERYYLNRGLS